MKCYDIINEGTVTFDPGSGITTPGAMTGVTGFGPEIIVLSDQFSDQSSSIRILDKICADAEKRVIVAGTFIPLESVAILLAGAHMSSAWLLPALVAIAGVGYGIEIARKYQKDTKWKYQLFYYQSPAFWFLES